MLVAVMRWLRRLWSMVASADETSLNNTAAAYSAMTGSDGTKILTITRPDTHGTKTSLTARLYSDTTKKATLDTIFYRCNQSGQR